MASTVSVTIAVKGGKLEVTDSGVVWHPRRGRARRVGWAALSGLESGATKRATKKRATKKRATKTRATKKRATKKRNTGRRTTKKRKGALRAAKRSAGGPLARLGRATTLRGIYKGKTVTASTTRDGRIKVGKKTFASPTAAAGAIVRVGRRNGWNFWHYRNARGKWVPLSRLR